LTFPHLSAQEREAITIYESQVQSGDIQSHPIWVDSFSYDIFWDMPGRGEVVDVGCGTGRFVAILPDLGIRHYLGIDPSPGNIAYCQKTYPKHNFELGCIQNLGESYPARFSGFIMTACLMHVPRTGLKKVLRSLRSSLIQGAAGMISIPMGESLTRTHANGITTTLYTAAEMETQLHLHGFCIRKMVSPGHMLLLDVEAN
jgi:SAM-dependent methyltransferase